MNLLEDWGRGMDVDIHRCLLVTGIPEDCGQAEIEETLNGVLRPLGPYLVPNKIFLREENAQATLVEAGAGVNLRAVPREFPGRGGDWRVVCRDPPQDAEFLKNLNEFLEAEGRTWEGVVRLLQLNDCPPTQSQNPPAENWAEALGVLLGAVVQIIFYTDAEVRSQEEAGAQEASESYAVASVRKVKKEPGKAAEVGSALKVDNPDSWNDTEDEGDPPKPSVPKPGAKTRSRRRTQKKNPKQGPVCWKKPRGCHSHSPASLEDPEADDGENREVSEYGRSNRKPCVRQEESALKKPVEKCAWKSPRQAPQDAGAEAASDSDQDGGREGPPRKKGWAPAKSPALMRKKKKVSLGPVSYVLVDVEDAKKLLIPEKGPGWRRRVSVQRAPRGSQPAAESPAPTSQSAKAKPEGSLHGENDDRNHLGCVHRQMTGEEPKGVAGHTVDEEEPQCSGGDG